MLDLTQTVYTVACIESDRSIGIDISRIVEAESRLSEVATVNLQTAPELLSTFNQQWLDLNRMVSLLTYEKNKAENLFRQTRALALLDCNDTAIKARGHSKASADLREAMVELDARVIAANNKVDELTALVMYLKGKQDAFQKAYESVKKLVGSGLNNNYVPRPSTPEQPFSQKPPVEDDDFGLPKGFR